MLYAIAGNGTGPVKEITAVLKDLREKATQEDPDAEFWFILEAKDEPTATDNAIVKWMVQQEVWFETYSEGDAAVDGAQESHHADDAFIAMLERIQERQADSEEAALLVLLEDEPDEGLQRFVETAIDGDIGVYALNGEMARITLEGEDESEEAPAPAPTKATTKKAAAKAAAPTKKAASKAAAAPAAEEQDGAPNDDDAPVVYTLEELNKMTVAELGAVARSQGVDGKGLDKKTLIGIIDAKLRPPLAAVTVTTNGDVALVVVHTASGVVHKLVPMADALALVAQ